MKKCLGCRMVFENDEEVVVSVKEKVLCKDCRELNVEEIIQMKKEILHYKEEQLETLTAEIHELHGNKKNKIKIGYKEEEVSMLRFTMKQLVEDIKTLEAQFKRIAF
ncbi:hypothetical protein [Bacillus thuringiensis]|uniref:hypothetical protein n=1 Tax=Bacillus thuringiensis TaxID=1428 RepID=UPI0011A5E2FA|nr:hypothetical protein [Bacillus thuringiensis]